MVTNILSARKSSSERAEEFTTRYIKSVPKDEIYKTVSSIIDPYGLPCVKISLNRNGDKFDIKIENSNEFMHMNNLYSAKLWLKLVDEIIADNFELHMKFNGSFFITDGPITGLGDGECIDLN